MVELRVSRQAAVFTVNGVDVGTYVLDDPFKPYLHPLRTPAGHVVSLAMPHDHRHHKGLMYALATDDVNFWEEVGDEDHPRVGRQVQRGIDFDFSPGRPGLSQRLDWADDLGGTVFDETRTVSCQLADGGAVRWTWDTAITARRDVRLRMSPWSMPDTAGRPVNYHGLSLRFARSVGGPADTTEVLADGAVSSFGEVHGSAPSQVGIVGEIDGFWEAPRFLVSVRQLTTADGFFALHDDFTCVSTGPSVLGPVELARGETIAAAYEVEVSDR